MAIYTILLRFFTYGIFIYSIGMLLWYIFIVAYSTGETKKYLNKNTYTDYRILAASEHIPSVSIIAPAYNEGATIIENVRSLLSIYYTNLELIIVNDGSKDDTLQKMIRVYQLEKVERFIHHQIKTREVRGVYKSKNPVFKKLVVIDKVNGGKADALNVGINVSTHDYIVCIDVDCILEQDAILKMMKPFMEETDGVKVIASGGALRIANSCKIKHGKIYKVRLPGEYLPKMQTLEYIRAFLLGRMAWSRLNGLLIISGAFGAFNKEIVIRCNGYDTTTVGEDMDLIVRMRCYMEERKLPYRVSYIPDPLCWTEAPSTFKILGRQRNRWARGTIETLGRHKKMFFNPRYRLLGIISYPYWFFFEMLAPLVESFGFVVFLLMALAGMIDWPMYFAFMIFIISFGYLYSAFAVYMEVATYNQYKRKSAVARLLLAALTEPFIFHPFIVWSGLTGFLDKLKNRNHGWGEMSRSGFNMRQSLPSNHTS